MTIRALKIGESAVIEKVGGQGSLRRHLLEMGLTPGTCVELQRVAPLGDPVELFLRGYMLTIRLEEAEKIEVTKNVLAHSGGREGE